MAETFSPGTHVTALWGHRWYAGVVDDILDGGRAYEIAWADEETCNEVPAADVRALAVNEEPRPKKQKVQKPRADTKPPQKKRLGASPFVEMADWRLKHRGLANRTREDRPLLYLTYARPWFVDKYNFSSERYEMLPPLCSMDATRSERADIREMA